MDVNMTTLPSMDVRKIKKVIEQYLSPKLYSVHIQSNYQLKAKKPKIDVNILDTLVSRCPDIKAIQLLNCDLSEVLKV